MQRVPLFRLLPILPLALVFAGCGSSPSIDQVRWEIERRVPEARFEREEHIHLGRITFGLIKSLVRMVPGKIEDQELVTSIDRVEVATYRVVSLPPDLDRRALNDPRFAMQLARSGWSLFLREREKDNQAWVFVRNAPDGSLRSLFVVALDESELALVRLDGHLDRAFAAAVADDPGRVMKAVRGEAKKSEAGEDQSGGDPKSGSDSAPGRGL